MTTVTLAVYADGTLKEQLSDAVTPPAHLYFDTNGTTLLSSVPASQPELDILRNAATPVPAVLALSGSGPPANSLGVDGQIFVDVDSNFTYVKASGVWPVGATVQLARA
jgi:hypothetical protein